MCVVRMWLVGVCGDGVEDVACDGVVYLVHIVACLHSTKFLLIS